MSERSADADVVVVGAGAAGLAATKAMRSQGLSVRLLEAKARVGGRAWTDADTFGVPLDWGCSWLHSASANPFTEMADAWGWRYSRRPARGRLYLEEGRWESDAEHAERMAFYDECMQAILAAAEAGRDVAVSEVIPRAHRWRGMFDFWLAVMNAYESPEVSTLDFSRYRDTGENWPLADGYGALVARYGADLEVALGAPVTAIRWGGPHVEVRTERGRLRARAVVVTASTSVLAEERIVFDPPLPGWKRDAIEAVPLGYAAKVAFAFDDDVFGVTEPTFVMPARDAPRTLSFQLRPFGRQLAVGYLGGRFCQSLEEAGEEAMLAFGRERLGEIFGAHILRHVTRAACVRWGPDPHIRGAYSCARPGCADARHALGRPVDGRLFFAGEACSPDYFTTAHGAYLSGLATAEAVRAHLMPHGRG